MCPRSAAFMLRQVSGALPGVGCDGADRPLVIFRRRVVSHSGRDGQVDAEASRSEFGDQFFHRIAFIALAFAVEFTLGAFSWRVQGVILYARVTAWDSPSRRAFGGAFALCA
jgi:hypothetical protein